MKEMEQIISIFLLLFTIIGASELEVSCDKHELKFTYVNNEFDSIFVANREVHRNGVVEIDSSGILNVPLFMYSSTSRSLEYPKVIMGYKKLLLHEEIEYNFKVSNCKSIDFVIIEYSISNPYLATDVDSIKLRVK